MTADRPTLTVRRESFPIRGTFRISRGAKTSAEVVIAEITDGEHVGRGECVPYARYGETMDSVVAAIESVGSDIAEGLDRAGLQSRLPSGAARNAVDCAFWDLEAKRSGVPVWRAAGLSEPPRPVVTAYTLSLDTVEVMGRAAAEAADRPVLKLKLTGEGDLDRVRAVRHNAPNSRLIVDANEAWKTRHVVEYGPAMAELGVVMIEQPLPADADGDLRQADCPVLLAADESCHDRSSLDHIAGRYGMVNIKLDKTGGLTEALALKSAAEAMGLKIMVGCMVGSSLAMAPGVIAAQGADLVDLDGPLLLAEDRTPALTFEGSIVHPPDRALWG